jgi:2-succinyl-6-hydroxy-2,4-cyclohexadiene-1-carboxylate synthase
VAPPLLFLPGFMQPAVAWAPVAEAFSGARLLEHGEHTYKRRLAEIAEAGEGALVVGYSLGGRLALRAVLREPARYAGLVTIGATAGIDEPETRSARAEADDRLASWMETAPIESIVGVWERQPLFADQSEALIEAQRPGRLAQDRRDLAAILRTAGQGVLELPVLAVAGAHDEGYTAAARRIADTAPRGRAAIVEHAGHAPQLQRPDDVARLLADFADQDVGQ